jgi:uridine kinase
MHGSFIINPHPTLRKQYPTVLSRLVLERFNHQPHLRPFLVGISGPRNVTKSTSVEIISSKLEPKLRVATLSMDSYLKPPEFYKANHIDIDRQAKDPVGMDFERLVGDIGKLCRGETLRAGTRDRYQRDYRGPIKTINGENLDVLLIEGISALLPDSGVFNGRKYNPYIRMLSSLFALKIHLSIDPSDAEKVLFFKSDKRRSLGLPTLFRQSIYERFRMSEIPRFKDHYLRCRSNADLVCELFYYLGEYQLGTMIFTEDIRQNILGDKTNEHFSFI